MTQRETVLALLREHPEGICVGTVPWELSYTLRNRVSELGKEGHRIESAPCRQHAHHAKTQARYVLHVQPQQQVLL